MPKKFNILRHIDIETLDKSIDDWFEEYGYAPIILMSLDTVRVIKDNFDFHRSNRYRDAKVFVDPSMKYGEVELR